MTVSEILAEIPQRSVLVMGDVCLDRWCSYDPALADPSRETGIPRIAVVSASVTPGAAGTVANNLVALRARQVAVLGVVGDDGNGMELTRALGARGIAPELVVRSDRVPTFTYTKLINAVSGVEDLPRVDFVYSEQMPEDVEQRVIAHARDVWRDFDVIIVSDQSETPSGGVITPRVREVIGELAERDPDRVVWVDSRMHAEGFRHTTLKTNADEATAACQRAFGGPLDLERLRRDTASPLLIMTDGGSGATYVRPDGSATVPTIRVENPVDICGAGDSFSAGAALALSITRSPESALRFGNLVASITIMQKGTGSASPQQVEQAAARWGA